MAKFSAPVPCEKYGQISREYSTTWNFEKALAVTQAHLGLIPAEAAEEIALHCNVREMDFAKLKSATEHIGYPVLPVVQQLTALCRADLGQWCHWGATTQDITDTATILQIRSALVLVG